MKKFEINIEKQEAAHAAVVRCQGDIDAHCFDQLDDTFHRLMDEGVRYLVVDMRQVPYLSSAGIGVLIGANSEAEERGGGFALAGLAPEVLETFCLMGFDSMFTLVATPEEALKVFGSGGAGLSAVPPAESETSS